MHDFIQNASSKLGISPDDAKSATGGIMSLLQNHLEPEDFNQLRQKLPGSEQIPVQSSELGVAETSSEMGDQAGQFRSGKSPVSQDSQAQSNRGLMENVSHKIGGIAGLGGGVSGIMSMLSHHNMDQQKSTSFVSMFLDYVRTKAGSGMLDKIIQQVPGLSALSPMATAQR